MEAGTGLDFTRSADLVHQFTDMRALQGFALLDGGKWRLRVFRHRGIQGLIGDLYVRSAYRSAEVRRGCRALLADLIGTANVRRVEGSCCCSTGQWGRRCNGAVRRGSGAVADVAFCCGRPGVSRDATGKAYGRFYVEPWHDHHHESAAAAIALSYSDHLDSRINDQYARWRARRFINNIVQFPAAGVLQGGSYVAFDIATGSLAGLVLVSFVGEETGHITQLCVTPRAGRGLGYELLRQAVGTLRMHARSESA